MADLVVPDPRSESGDTDGVSRPASARPGRTVRGMSPKQSGHDDAGVDGPKYPIESVDNALRLLLMIAQQGQIRVSEASTELGTAVSTAHRLLAMLAHHGFVAQDPETKAYKAGHVLLRIGLASVHSLDIRALLRPFLEELRDETGETVHAALLQGTEVLFIDCAESPMALRVASRVGIVMEAHCTSVGKAWLACESEDFLRGLYPSPKLPALTPDSITSRALLMAELAEVRRLGYAHNEGEGEVGVGSVSCAVCDRHGKPVAGISVSVPLSRMNPERWEELTKAVQRTARAIAVTLP
jgi:IclR family transcriptional regulator, acetate operon repressor